jgi:hypothetical protein
MSAAARAVGLAEAFEDEREELGVDPRTRVAHDDPHVRVHALDAQMDAAPAGGELDGIGEQIPEDLL